MGSFPREGASRAEVMAELDAIAAADADWRHGRTSSQVYFAGDEALAVAQEAFLKFFSANGLVGDVFPSMGRLERDIVGWGASLLNGETARGAVTGGGSESNLCAVKVAREWAQAQNGVSRPEIVLPRTSHPSLKKAAHLLGLKIVPVLPGPDHRIHAAAVEAAITDQTALVVASAPDYPNGYVDPIGELGQIAVERNVALHVDSCVGGFHLPFLERLGRPVGPFDFRVPGVTSISADLHKYGFTAKGASLILFRDAAMYAHLPFEFRDWPMGRYATPTMAGTRPGGAIAAAWAVLRYFGEAGYMEMTRRIVDTTERLVEGIDAIPGLEVFGTPLTGLFCYGSDVLDIYAVADGMVDRGWSVRKQIEPRGIHFLVTPGHEGFVDDYLTDLAEVTDAVGRGEIVARGGEVTY